MGVVDRIGEMVVNLFSGKKGIVLIILTIIVSVGVWKFSGMWEERGFFIHMNKATEYVVKGSDLEYNVMIKKSEDYNVKQESLAKAIMFYKNAREEVDLAYASTQDINKREWIKCMNKTLDYFIKRSEKISEGLSLDRMGQDEEAMKRLDDIKKLSKLAGQQSAECQKLELKIEGSK